MSAALNDLLWSCGALGFLGLCFLGVRSLQKRVGLSPELSRKLVHMAMAVAVLPFPWVFRYRATVVIIGSLATAGMLGMRLLASKGEQDLGGVLYRVGRLRSVGELVYPPAVVVTYLMAVTPTDYVIPILVLGFADSMAALVGTEYARMQLAAQRESPKSLEGAVAFFCAAFMCTVSPLLLLSPLAGPVILLVSLLIAAISTLLELVCPFGLDNFLIPFFISIFLRRLSSLEAGRLVANFGLLLLYLAIALYFIRRKNITTLGVAEAVLVIFLTTLLGDFHWAAAPFLLAFTYSVLPPLSEEERERPLNYHDIETNLIPGLLIVVAGVLAGVTPVIYWMYATYYACLTAKNHSLRLYNYFPRRKNAPLTALVRSIIVQLLPAMGLCYGVYGMLPQPSALVLAVAAVLLELALSHIVVRRYRFPTISIRLGWICSLSSVLFAALVALPALLQTGGTP